jgi:hypothetical protein
MTREKERTKEIYLATMYLTSLNQAIVFEPMRHTFEQSLAEWKAPSCKLLTSIAQATKPEDGAEFSF